MANKHAGLCCACVRFTLTSKPHRRLSHHLSHAMLCLWLSASSAGLQGANAQFDFFLGEGDSVINVTNVVRNRRSCTDPDTAAKLVERTKRDPRFLGPNNTTRQVYELADLTWRGEFHPQTLHLMNYSAEFSRGYVGGYSVASGLAATPW